MTTHHAVFGGPQLTLGPRSGAVETVYAYCCYDELLAAAYNPLYQRVVGAYPCAITRSVAKAGSRNTDPLFGSSSHAEVRASIRCGSAIDTFHRKLENMK